MKSSLQTDEKTNVYPTKVTEIRLNPDDSMTFQEDSIIQDTKRNSIEARRVANNINSILNQKKDSM